MDRVQFLSDVATAKPGEKIVYHYGLLMLNRQIGDNAKAVSAVAEAAYEAWDECRVHLLQKRIAPGVCAYIAVKRPGAAHLRADQKPKKTPRHYITERKARVTAAVKEAFDA